MQKSRLGKSNVDVVIVVHDQGARSNGYEDRFDLTFWLAR